MPVFKFSL